MKTPSEKIKILTKYAITLILILTVLSVAPSSGQADSLKKPLKILKNTIRLNITNPMIFGTNCNILGYERVITKHQTLSVNIGRFGMRKFADIDLDTMGMTNQYDDKGFNFAIDYRFYLKKENKYNAPRGIYLGPYYSYNFFSRKITWDMNTTDFQGSLNTDINFTANLFGVQMGYQFVLWNRVSIDMILMGPGLWYFTRKTEVSTSLSPEEEALLMEKINEALKANFPGSDIVIKTGSIESSTVTHTSAMGFRYMINLGFRF
jgi:hypothetical protein